MLTVPEVAERMGVDVVHVRTLLKEGRLLGVRDEQGRLVVPERQLDGPVQVKHLVPVLTLLSDAGFTPEEALVWLTTEDETLPGSPLDALHENRATEVKRRAQALG
ncbi:MAG: Rv2175c family DNA-binding protein [Actinomycetota bacterium]|nr:Rv2175c family DNA-binding protein [Actinomycetota bacterium]